jgi:hypothetical protein
MGGLFTLNNIKRSLDAGNLQYISIQKLAFRSRDGNQEGAARKERFGNDGACDRH